MEEVPPTFRMLHHLRRLDLAGCSRLQRVRFRLRRLTSLTALRLPGAVSIRSVPGVAPPKLEKLDASKLSDASGGRISPDLAALASPNIASKGSPAISPGIPLSPASVGRGLSPSGRLGGDFAGFPPSSDRRGAGSPDDGAELRSLASGVGSASIVTPTPSRVLMSS